MVVQRRHKPACDGQPVVVLHRRSRGQRPRGADIDHLVIDQPVDIQRAANRGNSAIIGHHPVDEARAAQLGVVGHGADNTAARHGDLAGLGRGRAVDDAASGIDQTADGHVGAGIVDLRHRIQRAGDIHDAAIPVVDLIGRDRAAGRDGEIGLVHQIGDAVQVADGIGVGGDNEIATVGDIVVVHVQRRRNRDIAGGGVGQAAVQERILVIVQDRLVLQVADHVHVGDRAAGVDIGAGGDGQRPGAGAVDRAVIGEAVGDGQRDRGAAGRVQRQIGIGAIGQGAVDLGVGIDHHRAVVGDGPGDVAAVHRQRCAEGVGQPADSVQPDVAHHVHLAVIVDRPGRGQQIAGRDIGRAAVDQRAHRQISGGIQRAGIAQQSRDGAVRVHRPGGIGHRTLDAPAVKHQRPGGRRGRGRRAGIDAVNDVAPQRAGNGRRGIVLGLQGRGQRVTLKDRGRSVRPAGGQPAHGGVAAGLDDVAVVQQAAN